MRRIDLKIGKSRSPRNLVSLRMFDGGIPPLQDLLTAAGFVDGERVSIVRTCDVAEEEAEYDTGKELCAQITINGTRYDVMLCHGGEGSGDRFIAFGEGEGRGNTPEEALYALHAEMLYNIGLDENIIKREVGTAPQVSWWYDGEAPR